MSDINYDEMAEAPVEVSDEEVQSIAQLAERQIVLEDWIEKAEDRIKEAKKNLGKLTGELLPDAMRAAGVKSFTLENGCELQVSMDIKASISKKHQEAAFKWLRDHNQGDLIRNEYKISYGAGEDENADELSAFLLEHDRDFNQKEFVHHSTLPAFVRRELDDPEKDHDKEWEEMFGVFRHKYTKIIRPKT